MAISITKEDFVKLFPKIDPEIFYRDPTDDEDFIANFLPSTLWRICNLYTIIDKAGNKRSFKPNRAQFVVMSKKHNRKVILKSRQQGISTLHLIRAIDKAMFNDNVTCGLMAQGLDEAAELLNKARVAWEEFDENLKAFLGIDLESDNAKKFGFNNGSKLLIRTSFRSGTLQFLHVSELGKISAKFPEKAKELKTGTFQAVRRDQEIVLESTAEGKSGLFFEIWEIATKHTGDLGEMDFMPIFLSWTDDPDCQLHYKQTITPKAEHYFNTLQAKGIELTQEQKWWWVAKYRELGDEMFQEYPATPEEAFMAVRDGAYYSNQMNALRKRGGIKDNLFDENLDVYCAMDLGMSDDMTMVFFQVWKEGEVRIVDEYANSGEGILHYVMVMRAKPYHVKRVYLPHDAQVRELGTGKSRYETFRGLGVPVQLVKRLSINDGIEAVRTTLAKCWIDSKCVEVIGSLDNYSKEWDDKRGVWKDKPLHDKWSHMADALRYMAVSSARHPNGANKLRYNKGFAV